MARHNGTASSAAVGSAFGRLVEELTERLQAGEAVDWAAAAREYPDHATELEALRPALEALGQLSRAGTAALSGVAPAAADDLIPGVLGDFRILREVGRGGMGVVYEAEQISLNRRVALKVLPFAATMDPRQLQRFRHEAQAAAMLHHPHVVPVYGVGCERGVHYYAMQLIEGRSLAAVIDGLRGTYKGAASASEDHTTLYVTRRPAAETRPAATLNTAPDRPDQAHYRRAAELAAQAAEALEYAHSMGVVHRDVKPANLLLDAGGGLWVTDFGLARTDADAGLTVTGDLLGTLRYMSPEQALAKHGLVDHRTDIYSLGVTLYELLTVRPAFAGRDRQELLRQIAGEEPRPLRRVNPAIPADLETIVLKAVSKRPEERYATARELADDLRRFLDDRPIRARRPSPVQQARRWARRHPTLVWAAPLAGGLLLTLAVAVLAVSNHLITREQGRTEAARKETEAAKENLEAHLYYQTVALAARERAEGRVRLAEQLLAGCEQSRWRGWEWEYVRGLRHGSHPPLRHGSHLFCAALSPDGRLLAAGDGEGRITLWDARTWRQLRTILAHDSWARGLAFSPDGRRLASAGWDGKVIVWDVETGRDVWTQGGGDRVDCVAYSPDGRTLASSWNHDGTVRVWDADDGRVLRTFRAHRQQVFALAFSPGDGSLLATGGSDHRVRLWDTTTWAQRHEFPEHAALVLGVAFGPDGRSLAVASGDFYLKEHRGELKVWDVATGRLRHRLCGPTESVFCVAFSPDGRRLASGGSEDPVVKVWDLNTGTEAITLRGHTDAVWAVAFSPDGRCLISAGGDHTARVWDATPVGERPGAELHTLGPFPGGVASVAFQPGSAGGGRPAVLATGGPDGAVQLWDTGTGRLLRTLPPLRDVAAGVPFSAVNEAVASLAFSPDGDLLAAGSTRGTVRVWEARGWRELPRLDNAQVVLTVAFSPDGRRLAVTSGKELRLWDPRTGRLLRTLRGHTDYVITVAFNPDGRWLASAGYEGEVKVWDAAPCPHVVPPLPLGPVADAVLAAAGAAGGRPLRSLPAHAGRASCVAFSPDGGRLVSAGADDVFVGWRTGTWDPLPRLPGHPGRVHRVAFRPDGAEFASAGTDATVRVWDVATGRPVLTFRGHTDAIHGLAYSPDGRYLASASLDRTVKIWDADPPPDSPARTALDPGY
jgi:WD40 repeat protein/serine/threonine protein kinase